MAFTLEGSDQQLLPRSVAQTVLSQAFEQSVVGRLTSSEPMVLGDNVIPVYEGGIEAGVVGEGESKPVSEAEMSTRVVRPRKLATVVVVSKEAVRINPGRMLDMIQADMTNAITRAIDLLAFHGRDAKTGSQVTDAVYLDQTTNRVEVDDDDIGSTLLAGYDLASEDHDPNAFAFDTRLRSRLVSARDNNGNSVFQSSTNLAAPIDNVWGLPAAYGRAVPGRIGAAPATDTRGYIGDFDQVRWGYAENLTVSRSEEATVVDGSTTYHLWQQNLVGLLVEATVGITVLDLDAFAAFDSADNGGNGGDG